jgi:hypothetical protein
MSIALEQEYKYFLSHLEEFSKTHLNEFVVIKGEQLVGFFNSYEKALRDGLQRFGNVPFFIEEVKEEEVVHYFHQGLK